MIRFCRATPLSKSLVSKNIEESKVLAAQDLLDLSQSADCWIAGDL
jgi:hypothetical protein